jgi:hypothetical protein
VLLAAVHPNSPAQVSGGSLEGWVWLAVVLAVIVASGLVLASRR